jgi:hypothetical protein
MNKLREALEEFVSVLKYISETSPGIYNDPAIPAYEDVEQTLQAYDEQWPSDEEIEAAFVDWLDEEYRGTALYFDCWKSAFKWFRQYMEDNNQK